MDNENQNTIPNWLIAILEEIWGQRQDWFFGVDMGIYDREAQKKGVPVVVPDGFLSIGETNTNLLKFINWLRGSINGSGLSKNG